MQATFERSVVVRDFDEIELPLPDRGAPIHRRWNARAAAERATPETESAPEQGDRDEVSAET